MTPKFGLQADRYRRFRPGYPAWLFDRLAAAAAGKDAGVVLDLGAGSGQATGDLLARFDRVIAVEPDPDMARLIPPDPRLEVRVERAEDVALPSPADAALSATAFHWMDPAGVGRMLSGALRPGGVFLAFGYGPFRIEAPGAAARLLAAEQALWSPHVDPRLSAWRPYPELMSETGAFAAIEAIQDRVARPYAAADAAGLFLTTSYASAYARATGDEEAYASHLAARMSEAAGGGEVIIGFDITGALGRLAPQ